MGYIGEDPEEIELEPFPLEEPHREPAAPVAPTPVPEPVPA